MKLFRLIVQCLLVLFCSVTVNAEEIVVTSFQETDPGIAGVWFKADVRNDGTASVVDLTGLGGALEAGAPLPIGAALLTTEFSNNDKAEVAVWDDYGTATEIFPTLSLSYWFFKQSKPNTTGSGESENLAAAPSLKITISNPDCAQTDPGADCFGTLVYEPNWNGGAGPSTSCGVSTNPVADTWHHVEGIDYESGCFWWTGGFGQPNSFGGPPLRTLSEWKSLFDADPNFAGADFVLLSMGVGTFNAGQNAYFDGVDVSHNFGDGFSKYYDFEPAPTFACIGFDAPVADRTIRVRQNRAIPFGALLADDNGVEVTDMHIVSPPVINVSYLAVSSTDSEDVTDQALPAGHGMDGNAFNYTGTRWQYNLNTRNYSAQGTYVVTMRSGDEGEYVISPTCSGTFVIE